MILRSLCLFALLVSGAMPARADDPYPPALAIASIAEPAPIVQEGATKIYYEMLVTNFAPVPYVLDAINAQAGARKVRFEDAALAAMIRKLGAKPGPEKGAERTIEGGRSAIVFLELDLGKATAPASIEHVLHVTDEKGKPHEVVLAPLAVSGDRPIVVAPPLRGEWIAGNSVSNGPDAAHRRAVMVDDGHAWIAQRYAIDWVQVRSVDGKRTTWTGPEDRNESYFCWDKPIYSVAAGTVVDASDGMPENVPHSGKHVVEIDFNNAAGNHAVIEIAPHRFVLYAHMRPGSVQVKTGGKVALGQIIGHVGNTGSSEEPHLHMHIDDRPSFLGGNGMPYAFTRGTASGPVEANVASPTAVYFGPIGPQTPFVDDYPAANALVTFE